MDKVIQKHIVSYFNTFDSHVKKWNELLEILQRPMKGLNNQAEQLVHVERVRMNQDLLQFPNLKDCLTFKILNGIDEELILFKKAINDINALNHELRNKLVAFEKQTRDFDWYCENHTGNAFQPKLSVLLQLAYEGWRYYSEMYQELSLSYKALNIRNEKSLNKLQECLVIKRNVQSRINHILAVTQYCNQNS